MRVLDTQYPYNSLADSRQGGRPENQDTCAWGDTPYGFLVTVCDGMGGGPSGKTASVTAANALVKFVTEYGEPLADRVQLLAEAVQAANTAVYQMAQANPAYKGMGTTATALLINEESAIVAHVGDSRVYQFRHGRKVFRTWDHSQVFEKLKMGTFKNEEEARLAPGSNIILRAIGISDQVKVDVVELPYEKGDRFMLCTDGIWGAFPEKEIIAMAAKTAVLSGAVESLVVRVDAEGARNGGHHDNLTLALVETKIESKLKEEMSTKHRRMMMALAALCAVSLLLNLILLATRPSKAKIKETKTVDVARVVDSLNAVNDQKMAMLEDRLEQKQNEMIAELKRQTESNNEEEIRKIFDSYDELQVLRDELDSLIKRLEKLKTMKAGKDKDKGVDDLIAAFDQLTGSNSQLDSKQVAQIKTWLGNSISKKDDSKDPEQHVLGHYNQIIRGLRDLKSAL